VETTADSQLLEREAELALIEIDVDRRRLRAEYWLVPHVGRPTAAQSRDRVFTVPRGRSRLVAR
jgi:hypothetical protein